jgi:hypothetical protein
LAGGSAPWTEVRETGRKHVTKRQRDFLLILGLIAVDGEQVSLTERGLRAQVLGELDVTVEEVRAITALK